MGRAPRGRLGQAVWIGTSAPFRLPTPRPAPNRPHAPPPPRRRPAPSLNTRLCVPPPLPLARGTPSLQAVPLHAAAQSELVNALGGGLLPIPSNVLRLEPMDVDGDAPHLWCARARGRRRLGPPPQLTSTAAGGQRHPEP